MSLLGKAGLGNAGVPQRSTRIRQATMWLAGAVLAVACGSSAWAEQAQPIASRTELSASVAHTAAGTRAIFDVHVSSVAASAHASGVVTVVEGGQQIGSGVLNSDGDAAIESRGFLPGLHVVHALYSGSGNLRASVSAEADVTAEAATAETSGTPGFMAAATPTALNVAQGDTVTTTVTLTPVNGFSNYVSLSCTDLPQDTTCNFLPVNVFVSGTTATTSTLSVETYGATGPDAKLGYTKLGNDSPVVFACLVPGLLGLAGLGLRRRRWQDIGRAMLLLAGLGITLGSLSGCAQRYHYLNRPPVASPGTALGSTPFIIEAQAVSGVVVTTVLINNVVLTVQAPPAS